VHRRSQRGLRLTLLPVRPLPRRRLAPRRVPRSRWLILHRIPRRRSIRNRAQPRFTTGKASHASLRKSSKKKTARGQQKIDPDRAEAIQEALIREHYYDGRADGNVESGQRRRHAPLSVGSWLAIENCTRFASADQPWARSQPRPPAESGERDDDGAGSFAWTVGYFLFVIAEPGFARRRPRSAHEFKSRSSC
jgi:hypothetical protein